MGQAILFTQCLQQDFIAPLVMHAAPPNLLHIGRDESRRILGERPEQGPLQQLLNWLRGRPAEEILIIHLCDWHDPEDPAQKEHLRQFGMHCLKDSEGGRLVLGLGTESSLTANERVFKTTSLSDLENPQLSELLQQLCDPECPPRIGVIGVWTEAKVNFLLYDLKTRLGLHDLALCTALTAGASRTEHFLALDRIKKMLAVRCIDSISEFAEWLLSSSTQLSVPLPVFGPELPPAAAGLCDDDQALLRHLHREASSFELKPLTGGYSDAAVFLSQAKDALLQVEAPSVVKLGPRAEINAERVALERLQLVLGNHAPTILGSGDSGERAAIRFAYASMGPGPVHTLKTMIKEGAPVVSIKRVICTFFDEIWAPLYAAAQSESIDLLEYYGFSSQRIETVQTIINQVLSQAETRSLLSEENLGIIRQLTGLYARILPQSSIPIQGHRVGYVHGDLNTANLLIDRHRNVWVIDFQYSRRGHVLHDVAKLESDILYRLTPLQDAQELALALRLSQFLAACAVAGQALPLRPPISLSASLLRSYELVRTLRRIGVRLARSEFEQRSLPIALLSFSLRAASYGLPPIQRIWALLAATDQTIRIAAPAAEPGRMYMQAEG